MEEIPANGGPTYIQCARIEQREATMAGGNLGIPSSPHGVTRKKMHLLCSHFLTEAFIFILTVPVTQGLVISRSKCKH